jgi:hypothetical protein
MTKENLMLGLQGANIPAAANDRKFSAFIEITKMERTIYSDFNIYISLSNCMQKAYFESICSR